MNDVPPSYNIGKLCTEDPSFKFSAMFHAFFKIFIKGGALGKVDHYYIKKEYQARGAPHTTSYCGSTVLQLLVWTHPRRCLHGSRRESHVKFPTKTKSPSIYDLVTRYQMHKCSAYCKKPKKCGTVFVKKSKFGFPRPVRDTSCLNCVEDSLKTKGKLSPQTHRGRSQNQ